MRSNMNNYVVSYQFKTLNKNLKNKLKSINKYDEETLNLFFYKLNKQVSSLTENEITSLSKEFERDCNKSKLTLNEDLSANSVVVKGGFKEGLKARLQAFEERISNMVQFREESLFGAFSFLLFIIFLTSGIFNLGNLTKYITFTLTILFLIFIDKVKTKNNIQKTNTSKKLKSLLMMICFASFAFMTMNTMFIRLNLVREAVSFLNADTINAFRKISESLFL